MEAELMECPDGECRGGRLRPVDKIGLVQCETCGRAYKIPSAPLEGREKR